MASTLPASLLDAGVDDDDDDDDARDDPDDPEDDPLVCDADEALADLDDPELDEPAVPVAPGEALEHAKRSVDSVAA